MMQQQTPVAAAVAHAPAQTQTELDRLLAKPFTARDLIEDKNFDKIWRMADALSSSALSVPKELKGNIGDCLAIVTQAMIWGLNPFAVAQACHVINGKLGYEAKLVNAVVQQSGAIRGSFHYEYRGAGMDLECRVGAVLAGQTSITWGEWLRNGDCKVRNSPLWNTNPRQQLGYLQVKNWARAYAPGPVLGIYSEDELPSGAQPDAFPGLQDNSAAQSEAQRQEAERAAAMEALLRQQSAAAESGVEAYQAFWKQAGAANRKALGGTHEQCKARAIAADEERRAASEREQAAAARQAATAAADPETGELPATDTSTADWVADMDRASGVQP